MVQKIQQPSPILVVGCGVSGEATCRFLAQQGLAFKWTDTRANPPLKQPFLQQFGQDRWIAPDHIFSKDIGFKQAIIAPGLALDDPLVQSIVQNSIPVIGEMELFAQYNHKKIIAITGTNGKSTVTKLITHLCQSAGIETVAGGNIGYPALDILNHDAELAVLEISSFQLETMHSLKPDIGLLLNISEDHLDRHKSLQDYRRLKKKLLALSKQAVCQASIAVDHPALITFSVDSAAQYTLQQNSGQLWLDGLPNHSPLMPLADAALLGRHNAENILATWAVGHLMHIDNDLICHAMKTFKGLPHRYEKVSDFAGMVWINDSKATNVAACMAALATYTHPKVILIAGGQGKGQDFSPLKPRIRQVVKQLILFGEDKHRIAEHVQCADALFADTLDEAIALACRHGQKHDVVLFSPACASFDMFKHFEDRGDAFKKGVARL